MSDNSREPDCGTGAPSGAQAHHLGPKATPSRMVSQFESGLQLSALLLFLGTHAQGART